MVAREMPRTAAAFIELDYAHRVEVPSNLSSEPPCVWTAASANQCPYTMEVAAYDAKQAGVSAEKWKSLTSGDRSLWSKTERAALDFADGMSRDSDGITDEQFAFIEKELGSRVVASMVLHMAYANFQDRLIHCLGLASKDHVVTAPSK